MNLRYSVCMSCKNGFILFSSFILLSKFPSLLSNYLFSSFSLIPCVIKSSFSDFCAPKYPLTMSNSFEMFSIFMVINAIYFYSFYIFSRLFFWFYSIAFDIFWTFCSMFDLTVSNFYVWCFRFYLFEVFKASICNIMSLLYFILSSIKFILLSIKAVLFFTCSSKKVSVYCWDSNLS
jgi:hypothetical protein